MGSFASAGWKVAAGTAVRTELNVETVSRVACAFAQGHATGFDFKPAGRQRKSLFGVTEGSMALLERRLERELRMQIFIRAIILTVGAIGAAVAPNAHAVSVVPGLAGFGVETPAGRGGRIFRVTNLNADGAGSLEACTSASGPRICVFEVSGVIRLTDILTIRNPNVTIAGQTAPAPGVMLRGAGLAIKASDVLIQHISIRPGDDSVGPAPHIRDALKVNAADGMSIRNIVVDHCSLGWSLDEVVEVYGDASNITFSNNIVAEPLNDSSHPKGPHGYGALVASTVARVTFVGNLFTHAMDRNPRSGAEDLVFVNNVVYNHGNTGAFLFSDGNAKTSSLRGNVFRKGPTSLSTAATVRLDGSAPLGNGTKIYLRDNVGYRPDGSPGTDDPWSIVKNQSALSRLILELLSQPNWPAGLIANSTDNDRVLNDVLEKAGARPAERSAVDERVVGEVRNRSGRVVNCVAADGTARCAANAGGWPNYAENRRALSLPGNSGGDDDGNGYTNLEEKLHEFAGEVEGRATGNQRRPNPPAVAVE